MEYHQLNCIRERATVGDTGDRGGGAGSRNLSAAVETVELWKQEGQSWRQVRVVSDTLMEALEREKSGSIFIFASSQAFLSSEALRGPFSSRYHVPACFWTEHYQKSNGFFGWELVKGTEGENHQQHVSWFRFLVKQVLPVEKPTGREYEWYEMSFFSHSVGRAQKLMLCLDTPSFFKTWLLRPISSAVPIESKLGIYSMHLLILEELVRLYDRALWSLRDVVRRIETTNNVRDPVELHVLPAQNPTVSLAEVSEFPYLHDVARHAIHSTEVFDVAINNVKEAIDMVTQMSDLAAPQYARDGEELNIIHQKALGSLRFNVITLQNLRARSAALEARLRNQINLAFNLVAFENNKMNLIIGKAMQADSSAMRAIAFMTFIFLPATFVSTIFSMSFFNFTPGSPSQPARWQASEKLWVYWVVALPLTIATVTFWFARESVESVAARLKGALKR